MENNVTKRNKERLEETTNQLTDEHQSYFLGVLEALNFAQNAREIPVEETDVAPE